jgi:hypothetical protein
VKTHLPDVVLLQVGTNNMNHGLGIGMPEAKHYPNDGQRAQAAEVAAPLNESHLNGLGSRWGDSTYGTGYLKSQVAARIGSVLDCDAVPNARLVIAKIPPVGFGSEAVAQLAGEADCNAAAVARIAEFNAYIDQLHAALPPARRARVVVIDNFTGVHRTYGEAKDGNDFGPAESQAQDWVHPKPDANAWRLMGDNFYRGCAQAIDHQRPSPVPAGAEMATSGHGAR